MRIATLFVAFALLLIVLVLYSLNLMLYTEEELELATLKVLGMRSARLRLLLLTQIIMVSFAGLALGIPAGVLLSHVVCHEISSYVDLAPHFSCSDVLVTAVFVLLVACVASLAFTCKVRTIDLAVALKGQE